GGVFDIRRDQMRVFRAGEARHSNENDELIPGLENPEIAKRFGSAFTKAHEEIELIKEASPEFDHAAFLAGKQTPMFFGSAINNFGVQEVLDALVDLAPSPGRAPRCSAKSSPTNPSSAASCSRCRPTWIRPIAIAWPSCVSARAASSAACV